MTDHPRLSAIVPVHNKASFVQRCLGSMLRATERIPEVELILVENRSTDGTASLLDQLNSERLRVIHSRAATAGAARNEGARAAGGSVFCFLDADVVVPPDYFERVRAVFRFPFAAAAGCTVALAHEGRWIPRIWDALHDRGVANYATMINGADLAVRQDAFWSVGGFDESLVTGEDADLCLRLEEKGLVLLELPLLQVLHLDNPTTLRGFARKELWHGLGATATVRLTRPDRPLLLTLGHITLWLGALGLLMARPGSPLAWLAALAAVMLVPLMSVVYRRVLARRPPALLPALLLYQVYFLARAGALVLALLGRSRK